MLRQEIRRYRVAGDEVRKNIAACISQMDNCEVKAEDVVIRNFDRQTEHFTVEVVVANDDFDLMMSACCSRLGARNREQGRQPEPMDAFPENEPAPKRPRRRRVLSLKDFWVRCERCGYEAEDMGKAPGQFYILGSCPKCGHYHHAPGPPRSEFQRQCMPLFPRVKIPPAES